MSRTLLVALLLLVAVGVTALSTWRWASANGPDVNNDGHVRINDVLEVLHHYFEDVPTPTLTPTPTPEPTGGDVAAFLSGSGSSRTLVLRNLGPSSIADTFFVVLCPDESTCGLSFVTSGYEGLVSSLCTEDNYHYSCHGIPLAANDGQPGGPDEFEASVGIPCGTTTNLTVSSAFSGEAPLYLSNNFAAVRAGPYPCVP